MSKPISISDAEWRVMQVLWEGGPQASAQIVAGLSSDHAWHPKTVKTMLHRLTKKGVLRFEEKDGHYLYQAILARHDCVLTESRGFLERVFRDQPAALFEHFVRNYPLSADDLARLQKLLDEEQQRHAAHRRNRS